MIDIQSYEFITYMIIVYIAKDRQNITFISYLYDDMKYPLQVLVILRALVRGQIRKQEINLIGWKAMEEQLVSKLDQAVITHLETPMVRLGDKNQRIM